MSAHHNKTRTPPVLRESQKEQLLRYIVSTFPYSIWWKDRNCVYIGTNEMNARAAGLNHPDEIIGLTDHDLPWTTEEANHYIRIDKAVMQSGEPLLNIEETQRRPDGSNRYLLTCKVPLKDENGELFGILGAWTDITERKHMELALARAKDEAERADRAKGEFLATVSHELRTPATLILSPLEHLLQQHHTGLPEEVRRTLDLIRRNTARLLNVVNGVLDFSKADAGRMQVDWAPTDIYRFTEEIVRDIQPSAAARDRGLSMAGDALGVVPLDRYKYERILLNLLGNALKFSHPGGTIQVALRAVGGELYELSVRDQGIGIPAAAIGGLFSKFTQVDSSATRRYEGTGLGLALVKQFTELMRGSVSIESELDKGTTVYVRLPRAIEDGADQSAEAKLSAHADRAQTRRWLASLERVGDSTARPTAESAEAPVPGSARPATHGGARSAAADPHKPLLLIVDDNADMRSLLCSILSGYELMVATNGLEAQELIRKSPPHVIVSDVMMPFMSGVELVAWLKSDPVLRHIPIILVTARADTDAIASSLDVGADEYLVKPFAPNELTARVRSMVRLYDSYRRLGVEQAENARRSGMAQVAMEVLHNVGNAMSSAQLILDLIGEREAKSTIPQLQKALSLLDASSGDLPGFLASERGRLVLKYIRLALTQTADERQSTSKDIERLRERLGVALDTVRAQQGYVHGNAYRLESLALNDVVYEALRVCGPTLASARIVARLELQRVDDVVANRHDLMTVLHNLLENAKDALAGHAGEERWIQISTWQEDAAVCCAVEDNGPGVPEGSRVAAFRSGFTTKKDASGFGLHFCANKMSDFGGGVSLEEGGAGGARLVLKFPASAGRAQDDASRRAR